MSPKKNRDGEECNPSARDIEESCKEIQATWSRREKKRRQGKDPDNPDWIPPNIGINQMDDHTGKAISRLLSENHDNNR